MNVARIIVDHVQVVTDKRFDKVAKAIEQQLGEFNQEVYKSLAAGEDTEKARAKIEAMVGPSGFMLFRTSDHGALLRLAGQKKQAIQYLVGNPLFAIQMTQHDIRASLYAPLRVLLYEDEHGKACVEYDKPSSLRKGHTDLLRCSVGGLLTGTRETSHRTSACRSWIAPRSPRPG